MHSKSLLFLISAAAALSVGTVTYAGDRDHRDSRNDDHRREQDGHHDDRGRHDDHGRGHGWDSHGGRVWSHDHPYVRFYVGHRPPPMRHEYRPFRPSSRHYWIPGCWRWREGYADWVWVGGYWAFPPHTSAVWIEGYWSRGPYGWHRVPGHWR